MDSNYGTRVLFLGVCAFFLLFAGGPAAGGIVYWTDGFEDYPLDETIDGKGTLWTTSGDGSDGYVTIPDGESDKALQLRASEGGSAAVTWRNDTDLKPTGDQVLSFDFMPPEVSDFSIEIYGEDGLGVEHVIARLAHDPASPDNSLDFYNRLSDRWQSADLPILGDQWNTLRVSFNLDSQEDWFTLELNGIVGRVGSATEFAYGSPDCFTLHKIVLRSNETTMYFDDFAWIPEPATIALLGLGALLLRTKRSPRPVGS